MNGAANDDVNSTNTDETGTPASKAVESVSPAVEPAEKQNASSHPHLVVVSADSPIDAHLMASRLRIAREKKGATIEEVAHETRIHKDYIHALEEMRTDILPGMPQHQTYLRGYLKTYARFVGFKDVDDVAECYLKECGLAVAPPARPTGKTAAPTTSAKVATKTATAGPVANRADAASGRKGEAGAVTGLFAGILIAASLGAIAWFVGPWSKSEPAAAPAPSVSEARPAAPSQVETAPPPVVAAPVETIRPALPASAPNLSLKAVRRAYITVTGSDGTVYLSKEMEPGQIYLPRVNAGWTVTVRDGGAFEWQIDGQSLGTIAGDGEPAYALPVDEALTREPVVQQD